MREYDGLRGLAFILVAVHHLGLRERWPVGPDVFFVLSGFFITKSLLSRREQHSFAVLLAFHKRRALRLLPPAFVVIAAVVLVAMAIPSFEPDVYRVAVAALTFSINWQQSFAVTSGGMLCHLWSLAAEQQFYLLWPPIILLMPRKAVLPSLVALLGLAIVWRLDLMLGGASRERLYFGLDTHADALLLGCILALVQVPQPLQQLVRRAGAGAMLLLLGAAIAFPIGSARSVVLAMTVSTVLAALVVMAIPLGGWLSRVLLLRPLQMTGRCSYSLYLCHFPIVFGFAPHWPHGVKLAQILLSLACSAVLYLVVEKPLIRRLQRQKAAALPRSAAPAAGLDTGERLQTAPLSAPAAA